MLESRQESGSLQGHSKVMSESTRERFRRLLGGGRRHKKQPDNTEPPYQQTTLTTPSQPESSDTPAPRQTAPQTPPQSPAAQPAAPPFRQTSPPPDPPPSRRPLHETQQTTPPTQSPAQPAALPFRQTSPPPTPVQTDVPPVSTTTSPVSPAQVQWPRSKRSTAPPSRPAPQTQPEVPPFIADDPTPSPDDFKTPSDARAFLERVREKTNHLIQDFARGAINQRQFQVVYSHYQQQRQTVEKALIDMPGSGAWRTTVVEGKTTLLRQQFAALLISYAIYETESSTPLAQMGDFTLDTALIVPMLSSFRSITQEIFGGGMRRTEIEGGRWLCFVPGQCTTLIAIYQEEPASLQLQTVTDLHSDFERVYHMAIKRGEDVQRMAQMFTRLWAPVTHCQSDKDG